MLKLKCSSLGNIHVEFLNGHKIFEIMCTITLLQIIHKKLAEETEKLF